MVERMNRTLLSGLSKMARTDEEWDLLLPLVLMHYRATRHDSTGFSPAELMLGKRMQVPVDVLFPPVRGAQEDRWQLQERLEEAHRVARDHLKLSEAKALRQFPFSHLLPQLRVGMQVLLLTPMVPRGRTPKFFPKWSGPFLVERVISQWLYQVTPGTRRMIVHRNRLTPWPLRPGCTTAPLVEP